MSDSVLKFFAVSIIAFALSGCRDSVTGSNSLADSADATSNEASKAPTASASSAASKEKLPEHVEHAISRVAELGGAARSTVRDGKLTELVIQDGSNLTPADLALFGQQTDLTKLQIYNCRTLDDAMAASLSKLENLTSLAVTNSVINDSTVELISKAFPKLVDLDLSSNTNLTRNSMKHIVANKALRSLVLYQNNFNDISARRLKELQNLRTLDLRGNMEAGNMALEVVGQLPNLIAFKHRSTAVTDDGLESLAGGSGTLQNLLIQDFMITSASGEHLAKLKDLKQLEVFRCQGFGSDGVVALKGLQLERLTLRDLPAVDDAAMDVFTDLPALKRLYLHELGGVSDAGLEKLASLQSLELLDIWTLPQLTDASIDVLAGLPKLKELSIRATGITDAAIDKLLALPNLQSLTIKENGGVSKESLKRLLSNKWTKLDIGK